MALSALLWRGTPYRLLEAICQRSDIRLFSSPALLAELADVLSRPSPNRQPGVIGLSARDVLADHTRTVEVIEPLDVPRVAPTDADDDHVIAADITADITAAITAGATLIVSGDSDVLSLAGTPAPAAQGPAQIKKLRRPAPEQRGRHPRAATAAPAIREHRRTANASAPNLALRLRPAHGGAATAHAGIAGAGSSRGKQPAPGPDAPRHTARQSVYCECQHDEALTDRRNRL